jgi:hypothetical protein
MPIQYLDNQSSVSPTTSKIQYLDDGSSTPLPSQNYSLSGLAKNVLPDIGRSAVGMANLIKQGTVDLPEAVAVSPAQVLQGTPIQNTELGKFTKQGTQGIKQGIEDFASDPIGAMYRNPVTTATSIYGAGKAIGGAASGIGSLFEEEPTLNSAGIKRPTLQSMTPAGVNPATFGKDLETQLNAQNLIGKTPPETFDNFSNAIKTSGNSVARAKSAIAQAAGSGALAVSPETALGPLYQGWSKEINSIVPDGRTIGTFGKYYEGLANIAKQQGGSLTLDNLDDFLHEVGPKTYDGPEALQPIYRKIYAAGANARDNVVSTIAQQANDPSLRDNFLQSNAQYSKLMRLMPDINKSAATFATAKEPISTFGKIAPYFEKGLGWGTGGTLAVEAVKKLLGKNNQNP